MSAAIQRLRYHINHNLSEMIDRSRLDWQDLAKWAIEANLLLDEITLDGDPNVNRMDLFDPMFAVPETEIK